MEVTFWGVRGSIPSSGDQRTRIGGNTSCVEVTSQGEHLILDAGTGVRALGEALERAGAKRAWMLFSHLHWDHVQGFPFFAPAYRPGFELSLLGPFEGGDAALRRVLSRQMEPPSFPVALSDMGARLAFGVAAPDVTAELGPFRVTPFEVPHPQRCLGFRVEADGEAFVYLTDVELPADGLPNATRRWLERAEALCVDAQYTPDEYAGHTSPEGRRGRPRRGWGHSTHIGAARLAMSVGAQRLFLFHHDPARTDDAVEAMAEEARAVFSGAEPAREGKRVRLSSGHAGEPAAPELAPRAGG